MGKIKDRLADLLADKLNRDFRPESIERNYGAHYSNDEIRWEALTNKGSPILRVHSWCTMGDCVKYGISVSKQIVGSDRDISIISQPQIEKPKRYDKFIVKESSQKGKIVRVTRIMKDGVYIIWAAYGHQCSVRGLSKFIAFEDLYKKYTPINN